jgi:hypothetical protein
LPGVAGWLAPVDVLEQQMRARRQALQEPTRALAQLTNRPSAAPVEELPGEAAARLIEVVDEQRMRAEREPQSAATGMPTCSSQ